MRAMEAELQVGEEALQRLRSRCEMMAAGAVGGGAGQRLHSRAVELSAQLMQVREGVAATRVELHHWAHRFEMVKWSTKMT